jgi:hypothetical protein
MAGTCSLCRGMIPAGELFLDGKDGGAPTGEVCLSCILTAVRGILPGDPWQVVVELDADQADGGLVRYRIEVNGGDLVGVAKVDEMVRKMGKESAALLTLVCTALNNRHQAQHDPDARYITAGDGWCSGPAEDFRGAPRGIWLLAWVNHARQGESWTPAILLPVDRKDPDGPVDWHFTYQQKRNPKVQVLAWKRGPARPRFLDVGEVTGA